MDESLRKQVQHAAARAQASIDQEVSGIFDEMLSGHGASIAFLFSRDNYHELRSVPDHQLRILYRLAHLGYRHMCVTKMGGAGEH